jgi:aquaporin Z
MSSDSPQLEEGVKGCAEDRSANATRHPLLRERLAAECVGTFFLVLTVGVSVVGGGSLAAVSIGLVLGIQIYTFGSVSGGMFNPAVTLAVFLSRRNRITAREAALYVLAQDVGAILGAKCAFAVTEKTFCFSYEATHSLRASLILEILFTLLLCSSVLATGVSRDAPNHYFGFAIGLSVTGGAIASGGFDQGSFNPAVTLGINIANFANSDATRMPSTASWFLFLLAPLLGGVLAAAIFRATRGNEFEAEVGDEASSDASRSDDSLKEIAERRCEASL